MHINEPMPKTHSSRFSPKLRFLISVATWSWDTKRNVFGSRPRMTKPKRCVPPDEEPVRFLTIKPTVARYETWRLCCFHVGLGECVTLRDPRPHDNGPDFTSRLFARFPSAVASWLNSLLLALVQEEESSITTQPLSRTPPFFHSISRHSIHEDIMEAVPLRHRTPTNSIACLIAYVPFSLLSRNSEDESHPLRRGENFVADSCGYFPFSFFEKNL